MKSKICCASALFMATVLFGFASRALAATINVSVDEKGNGSINTGSGPTAIPGSLQQDPGPGGQASALTYVLNAPNLTAGDLMLSDSGKVDDIIRFNPAGAGGNPNYLASLVFYSSNSGGVDSLADGLPPLANYTNILTVPEVGNGAQYTPTSGQPGFVSGFTVSYGITSDVATPEPSSIFLTLSGIALFAGLRIKRS